jgi:hypothetical protein
MAAPALRAVPDDPDDGEITGTPMERRVAADRAELESIKRLGTGAAARLAAFISSSAWGRMGYDDVEAFWDHEFTATGTYLFLLTTETTPALVKALADCGLSQRKIAQRLTATQNSASLG